MLLLIKRRIEQHHGIEQCQESDEPHDKQGRAPFDPCRGRGLCRTLQCVTQPRQQLRRALNADDPRQKIN